MSGGAIQVRGASKCFPSGRQRPVQVFENLSFEVPAGQLAAVFGPNGCGKSTLLQAIAGLFSVDEGEVLVDGLPPKDGGVGYIFQDYRQSLFPWLTAGRNIAFPLALRGVSRRDAARHVESHVSSLAFDIPLDSFPYSLSGGQQQLVAIARALIVDPATLVLDEPFSALDLQTRLRMQLRLEEIWTRSKRTMLMVSHDLDEAIFLADRVIILSPRPARIVADLEVRLPRPRTREIEGSEEFFRLRRTALSAVTSTLDLA